MISIEKLYSLFVESKGISTDTRKIEIGSIFFALKGANFNGNLFANKALELGAKYAVVDEEHGLDNENIIRVDDTLSTLQHLANFHRRTFDIPFIAITGSNGKTTTKELINAVLQKKYKTYATVGNLNNHIGIPLTLLSITRDIEIAVIEMGANHQKEIESYCKYVEPTHGLITNIGKAHLEGFGGLEGVKKGKGELYDYLLKNSKIAFLCTSNTTLMGMSKFNNPVTYPLQGNFYNCSFKTANPYIVLQAENGATINTKLAGDYNFDNIAVALCIGKYFGVDANLANQAIAEYDPANNRSQIIKTKNNTIVIDCYNANPTSMKAAIESFANTKFESKILIIGDMFELGDESQAEHAQIGELIQNLAIDKAYLCGKEMKYAFEKTQSKAMYFDTRESLIEHIQKNPIVNSHLLIKGSRGMALEKILEFV